MPHIPGHEYTPRGGLSYGRTSQPPQDEGFLSNVWSDFLQPGLETVAGLPVIKQVFQGLGEIQNRAVIPTVSRALEPLPIRFEERPGAPEVPWYDIPGQFGRGDISFNFDQYVTPEGRFSPSALVDQIQNLNPANVALEVIGENLNRDFDIFEPETRRSQNVQKEIQRFEQANKRPATQVEQRQIEEDLYKLPPYTRGLAEEAPWIALPPARVARASLQAVREGQRLSSAGRATTKTIQQTTMEPVKKRYFETLPDAEATRLGVPKGTTRVVNVGDLRPVTKDVQVPINIQGSPLGSAAPVARAALRGAEIALKPVEIIETAMARVIESPFRLIGRGADLTGRGINRVVNRTQILNLSERGLMEGDNIMKTNIVDAAGNQLTPEQKLFEINDIFERKTGISNRYRLEETYSEKIGEEVIPNYVIRINDDAVIPDRIRIRTDEEVVNIPKSPQVEAARAGEQLGFDEVLESQRRQEFLNKLGREPTDVEEFAFNRRMSVEDAKKEIADKGGIQREFDFDIETPIEEMSVNSYQAFKRLNESPLGQAVDGVLNSLKSSKVVKELHSKGKNADKYLTDKLNERFPNLPTWFIEFNRKHNDAFYGLKGLIDDVIERSVNPAPYLKLSKEALINFPTKLGISSSHAVNRASNRIENVYRKKIIPAIDKGVKENDISNLILARFHLEILNAKNADGTLKFPNRAAPQKFETAPGETLNKEVLEDMVNLKSNRYADYNADQIKALEDAVDGVNNFYIEARAKLYKNGIIDKETYDYLRTNYKHYNPITYVEFIDDFAVEVVPGKGRNVVDNTIRTLDEKYDGKYTTRNAVGETLWENIIRQEVRIVNNENTRTFARLYQNELGFKEVTTKFLDENGKYQPGKSSQSLYNDKKKTGYFSFYEDGKRVIIGGVDGAEVPRDVWETLNGRAGLNLQSPSEIAQKIAMSNGWFRSMYTTYNPLFWTRNMVIDGLTVWLKTGTMPHQVGMELMKDLYSIATNSEQRFVRFIGDLGGWQGDGYIGRQKTEAAINATIKNADQSLGAIVVDSDKALRKVLKETTLGTMKDTVKKIGGAVEAAPRHAVGARSVAKGITDTYGIDGKTELKRILKLSETDYVDEMFNDYIPGGIEGAYYKQNKKGIGRGFADTDIASRAATNTLEATLNFSRGGERIRRWNDYVLFLNAAMEGSKLPFRALGIDVNPVIRPVRNPKPGEPLYEFGSISEQLKRALGNVTAGKVGRGPGATGRTLDNVTGGPFRVALRLGAIVGTYWAIMEGWNKLETFNGTPLYYDIPDYVRYNSMIFMLPADRDENGDYIIDPITNRPKPKYIVIPHRLREWNSIFQGITWFSETSDEMDSYQDKQKWMYEIATSAFPISDIPLPEIMTIGAEQLTGYDTWRKTPIVSEDFQEGPLKEQYSKYTTKTMREAAGIFENVPVPEPLSEIIASPDRLEHLYESIFGGVGTTASSITDYGIQLFNDLRNEEPRPMEEQVAKFREMDKTQRIEFMATLTDSELEEFEQELREPEIALPFFSKLTESFFPSKGGGLDRTQQARVEKMFPEISTKESRAASKVLAKTNQQLSQEQKKNDEKLNAWMQGKTGKDVLSPSEWREERSAKYDKYEGAVLAIAQKYKFSVQAQDEETKQQYYDALHYFAGQDKRTGVELLIAGYRAIKLNETPDSADWDVYNQARDEYLNGIRLKSEANNDGLYDDLIRRLEADDTNAEKLYKGASDVLSEYWSIGNSLDGLYGQGYSNNNPELAKKWQEYLNADTGTKTQMRRNDQQINTLVQRRSELRKLYVQNSSPDIDGALAFWYGDFYTPITPVGKQIYTKYYGGQQLFTNVQGIGTTFIPR